MGKCIMYLSSYVTNAQWGVWNLDLSGQAGRITFKFAKDEKYFAKKER